MSIIPWKLRVQARIQSGDVPNGSVLERANVMRAEAMQEEINELHARVRTLERAGFRMRLALGNASKRLCSSEDNSTLPAKLMSAAKDGDFMLDPDAYVAFAEDGTAIAVSPACDPKEPGYGINWEKVYRMRDLPINVPGSRRGAEYK